MTPEAAKELDRRCVWNWLNDVYRNPTVAFNTYSDEQLIELAHDALVLLKEQDAQLVLSNRVCETEPFIYVRKGFCPKCHQVVEWYLNRAYCGFCGQAVKWDESD